MSHELRTPLNAILGMADLLAATPNPAEAHELVATLQQSTLTLLHLVDDVLDYARIDHGTLTLTRGPFDLRRLAEDVLELFALAGDDKRLTLAAIIDPTLTAAVLGDAARLRQVLVNLVGNAVKFTEAGAVVLRITRETRSSTGPSVAFTVTDTGIGIPPALLPHVFDAFVQAEAPASRHRGGTGLGLALAQRIVARMGGRLSASSIEGAGSSFSFAVPLGAAELPPASSPGGALGGRRAIVVAADPVVREALMAQLAALAVDAVALPSGDAALGWLREATTAPDAVIVDTADSSWLVTPPDRFAALPRLVLTRRGDGPPVVPDARARTLFVPRPVRLETLARQLAAILAPPLCDAGQGPPADAASASPPWLEPPRVLVAEDNAANQRFVRLVLEAAGVAVDVVENGVDAVTAVRRRRYDLVLMDWRMPMMDGLEATTRIRQEPGRSAHVPIVALTANTVLDAPDTCLAAGMDAALRKPLRPRELVAAVMPWLGPRPYAGRGSARSRPPATRSTDASPAAAPPPSGEAVLDGEVVAELLAFAAEGRLFVEMRDAFIEVVPRQRAALAAAVDERAAQALLHAAHAIKGVAGQVGAREVQGLAAGLEELGRCGTVAGARALLGALDAAIARAEPALADVRSRGPGVAA